MVLRILSRLFQICGFVFLPTGLLSGAHAQDVSGAADHPLVGRFQGARIVQYESVKFNEQRFLNRPLDLRMKPAPALTELNSVSLSGANTRIRYNGPAGRTGVEVYLNHAESLKSRGFEVVFSCVDAACLENASTRNYPQLALLMDGLGQNAFYTKSVRYLLAKRSRPQGDVHVGLLVGDGMHDHARIAVRVLESQALQLNQIENLSATQMSSALQTSGKVALYGILFDTGKSEVKPESAPALEQIARFLIDNRTAQLLVVGHTDNQGGLESNQDLSRQRAVAVVAALTSQHGIAKARLTPVGVGMAAPVASNDSEAGRSKNRRVELVLR